MSNPTGIIYEISDPTEMKIDPHSGGREAIHRILEAYNFKNRQALCAHLDVSQSTMANRYSRDTFPSDWVIRCSAETNTSLQWLVTGKGAKYNNATDETTQLQHKKITSGVLIDSESLAYDKKLLPSSSNELFAVTSDRDTYLIESYQGEATDGLWLIEIDQIASIRQLYRFPAGRIRVENGRASFECQSEDIKILGKVRAKTEYFE